MSPLPGLRRVEQIMGMPIVLDVRDSDDESLLERVFEWLREVDARFSTYKPDSEISRLNAGELRVAECHPDVREVLARCDELRELTDGYFDARYASLERVDPSGLVKGWSVDRAGELLDAAGVRDYSINAAGDILMRGGALPDDRWHVGIQHPEQPQSVAAVVEARDLALATSGTYERGAHILDPRTGEPPQGLLSVSIAGVELATADALATAAFAMGGRAPLWLGAIAPYEALLILPDGQTVWTPRFPLVPPQPL